MNNKLLIALAAATTISLAANADYPSINAISAGSVDNNTVMVQSPVYVDDIGRSHFLSRGGYKRTRKVQDAQYNYNKENQDYVLDRAYSKTSDNYSKSSKFFGRGEKNVSDVIGTPEEDSFSFASTDSYYEKVRNNYDTTSDYPSGVNPSKTIYTDGIGREHFFGKANLIK